MTEKKPAIIVEIKIATFFMLLLSKILRYTMRHTNTQISIVNGLFCSSLNMASERSNQGLYFYKKWTKKKKNRYWFFFT